MFPSHTHSLPITTGSGQTTPHYSSSYLFISKLPTIRFDYTNLTLSHLDSYTHSTKINYPVKQHFT